MHYQISKNNIDPFVDITQLCDGVWSFIARSPGMGGDARSYLVLGAEKALLIDTGFGIGNLKGLCRFYTDLPLEVVNTHFHPDHIGGNPQFDRVWIHRYDEPFLAAMVQASKERPFFSPARDDFYTKEDIVPAKEYEICPLEIGHVFDLGGGHELEVLHTPGHSPGGISLLEKKRRMLFTGDAIVYTPIFMFGQIKVDGAQRKYVTIEGFRDALCQLRGRKAEFDGIFPGHHNMNLSPDYVDELLACCNDILADPNCNQEQSERTSPDGSSIAVKTRVHARGLISYSDNRIR